MGNYRFRLADMMPNAWFYKLRDMSKTRNQNPSHSIKEKLPPPSQNPRKSFYNATGFVRVDRLYTSSKTQDPPRKSSKKRSKRRTVHMPSPRKISPSVSGDHSIFQGRFQSPDDQGFLQSTLSGFQYSDSHPGSSLGSCTLSSSATDIIIDVDKTSQDSLKVNSTTEKFNLTSEPELPPILTKLKKQNSLENQSPKFKNSSPVKFPTENRTRSKKTTSPGTRKSVSRSGRVRIRGGGAKPAGKKVDTRARKSMKGERKQMFYYESLALVKASLDPERDFRDSMMEMIVDNNIRASKDLEHLLACYLSLNSDQYHDLIIKAFEQIWFNMPQPHF